MLRFIANLNEIDSYYEIVRKYCFNKELNNNSFKNLQNNIKIFLDKIPTITDPKIKLQEFTNIFNDTKLLIETSIAIFKAKNDGKNPKELYIKSIDTMTNLDNVFNDYKNQKIVIFCQREKLSKTESINDKTRATTNDNILLSLYFIQELEKRDIKIENIGIASNYMFNLRQSAEFNIYIKTNNLNQKIQTLNTDIERIKKEKDKSIKQKAEQAEIGFEDYIKVFTHIENDAKIIYLLKEHFLLMLL